MCLVRSFLALQVGCGLDYCDEHKDPFSKTKDYAGYVIENLKYLVKRFNKENR